jgi:hypothetical protein
VFPNFCCSDSKTQRASSLFTSYSTWSRSPACDPSAVLKRNRSDLSPVFKIRVDHDAIFIVGGFPKRQQGAHGELPSTSLWSEQAIAWRMLPPKPTDGTCWRPTDYSSTLPSGWMPNDGEDFFALFIDELKERWLEFCSTGQERLSQRVSITLQSLGVTRLAKYTVGLDVASRSAGYQRRQYRFNKPPR